MDEFDIRVELEETDNGLELVKSKHYLKVDELERYNVDNAKELYERAIQERDQVREEINILHDKSVDRDRVINAFDVYFAKQEKKEAPEEVIEE